MISSDDARDVERLAEHVEDVALGHVADRDGDGRAGVGHLGAAHQTVGRLHRDRADQVVAEVLGDLEGQRLGQLTEVDLDGQRVVQRGKRVAPELDVDDRADDPGDPPRLPVDRRRWSASVASKSVVIAVHFLLRRARRHHRRSR